MRAWCVREFGPFRDVLELERRRRPRLEEGSVILRTRAAGINFPDILMIAGKYQVRPEPPFVPGFESAGEVVETSTPELEVGTRVVCQEDFGAFSELRRVAVRRALPIPETLSFAEAAASFVTFQTAYFALVHRTALQPGETLLVHGAAGGVGSAAVQLGRILGATVIATAGSDGKIEVCRRLGAHHTIAYRDEDLVPRIEELTGGRGADVIFDPVGGDVFDTSTRCIAWEGRLLTIGFAGGRIPSVAANRILLKNIAVVGLFWTSYWQRKRQLILGAHERMLELIREGRFRPLIWDRLPLEGLPDALEAVYRRATFGKLILVAGQQDPGRSPKGDARKA